MSISEELPSPKGLLEYGKEWEDVVLRIVRMDGWKAELHGQRANPDLQEILRGTQSLARYSPDIIARSPQGQIVFIECKRSYPGRTGNHAIQMANLDAQVQWVTKYPTDGMVFAFPSEDEFWPCWMSVTTAARTARSASFRGRGSGTPFYVVPHDRCQVGGMDVAAKVANQWKK